MDFLSGFKSFLEHKRLVPEKKLAFYLYWVSSFVSYCEKQGCLASDNSNVGPFLHLLAKTKEEWQVVQARQALRLYHFYLSRAENEESNISPANGEQEWQIVAAKMREALRLRHRSIRTEKTYLQWLRSFYFFVGGKSVNDIGSRDVKNFLSELAVTRRVAASTQNQAFNALLFFFAMYWTASWMTLPTRFAPSAAENFRSSCIKMKLTRSVNIFLHFSGSWQGLFMVAGSGCRSASACGSRILILSGAV